MPFDDSAWEAAMSAFPRAAWKLAGLVFELALGGGLDGMEGTGGKTG